MSELYHGDCIEVMRTLDADSVDAIVTDPPYDLTAGKKGGLGPASRDSAKNFVGFMGKQWDGTGIAFDPATWCEALRVLKPGGHLVAFGGTRTYHRMACAIEDAGFEIRDTLSWNYGSGFPKSKNVSADKVFCQCQARGSWPDCPRCGKPVVAEGFGTGLKPAFEPIVLARKPLSERSVAANVLRWGTGAINIDACRIAGVPPSVPQPRLNAATDHVYGFQTGEGRNGEMSQATGRWPANVILDEEAAVLLDEQSGECGGAGQASGPSLEQPYAAGVAFGSRQGTDRPAPFHGDTGGASRFFYTVRPDCETDKLGAWESADQSRPGQTDSTSQPRAISEATSTDGSDSLTMLPGNGQMDLSPEASRFTTETTTSRTTPSPTSNSSTPLPTSDCTAGANSETANGGSPARSASPSSPSPSSTGTSAGRDGRSTDAAAPATSDGLWLPSNSDERLRFRYTAKASAAERSQGLATRSTHPTVKPIDLMGWLIKLVTPPGGTVLDPFGGSGTTAIAAIGNGFDWVLIEREAEYIAIAEQRIGLGCQAIVA